MVSGGHWEPRAAAFPSPSLSGESRVKPGPHGAVRTGLHMLTCMVNDSFNTYMSRFCKGK